MSGQGAAIGAATGATYALATGKDPVKYAVIGGAVGGAGPGAASALGLTGTTAATTAGTVGTAGALTPAAAGTVAGTSAGSAITAGAGGGASGNLLAVPSYGAPSFQLGASAVPSAGVFSTPAAYTPSLNVPVDRSFGTLESIFNPNIQSSSMAPSFMEQLGSGASQVGKYAERNPQLTAMAMQSAQQALQQPQAQMAPAGQVSRGEIKGGDYYSLLNSQQNTVLRPQPISLLG